MNTKNLSTALNIIKILKLMTEKPVSVNEILDSLEKDEIFVNKETISKYFTTLRQAGCDIQKRRNKFYIKYPILEFQEEELKILKDFQEIVLHLNSKNNYICFLKFLDKLFALTDLNTIDKYKNTISNIQNKSWIKKLSNTYKEKIEILSEFITENPQKLALVFENKDYTITPIGFHYHKNSVCLLGYDNKTNINKSFPLNKITSIKQTPLRAPNTEFCMGTTFKITGRLKEAYLLREDETADYYNDYAIITNKKEDKKSLFCRLLKYGTNCEILYPISDRNKFKDFVEKLILNTQSFKASNP